MNVVALFDTSRVIDRGEGSGSGNKLISLDVVDKSLVQLSSIAIAYQISCAQLSSELFSHLYLSSFSMVSEI